MQDPTEDFMTLPQLAQWLRVGVKMLREKIEQGRLPDGVRLTKGGQRRWDKNRAAVVQWILSHPEAFKRKRVNSAKQGNTGRNQGNTGLNSEGQKS